MDEFMDLLLTTLLNVEDWGTVGVQQTEVNVIQVSLMDGTEYLLDVTEL